MIIANSLSPSVDTGHPTNVPLSVLSFTVMGEASFGDRVLTRAAAAQLTVLDETGTTFSGFVFDTEGNPVKGAKVSVGQKFSLTDETGRFLVMDAPVGDQILIVDGTTASNIYAVIPFTVHVVPNTANLFNQTVYLHKVNRDYFTPISYPNEVIAEYPILQCLGRTVVYIP